VNEENSDPPQVGADELRYQHLEQTETIISAFYEVYNELGHGFLEKSVSGSWQEM
jgi:hypothetical protein